MGEIGNLGDITFFVRQVKHGAKILSFTDLKRESTARISEHEGKVEKLEFDGPGLDEITLTIIAKADFKVKPQSVQNKLHKYIKTGKRLPFVLGGKKVGYGFYAIKSISQTYKEINIKGQTMAMTFDVTLKQYPKTKKKAKTTKSSKNNKNSKTTTTKNGKKLTSEKTTTNASTSASGYEIYTVKKGDTLSAIALKYYKKASAYTKIYNANKEILKNPGKIYEGQKLKIPK